MIRLFLLRFFESYFRHRWLYLLPIVVMMGAAAYYFLTLTPKYVARGVLYVNNQSLLTSLTAIQNNDTNWWITPAQATSNEINELMQTDAFVRAVVNNTDLEQYMNGGIDQIGEVLGTVRSSVGVYPTGNNQLYVSASFDDSETAYQLVNAVINSYVQWQTNTMRNDSQVAKVFFAELIENYEIELEAARQALKEFHDTHPAPLRGDRPASEQLELARLQGEVDLLAARFTSALEKGENADLAMTQIESDVRQTYVVLDAPTMPDRPDLSKRKIAIQFAAFLAAGFVLSVVGVAGATFLDRSFKLPVDVEDRLHLPVLASIPDVTPKDERRRLFWRILSRPKRAATEESINQAVPKQNLVAPDQFSK